jgi:hypothetical protein
MEHTFKLSQLMTMALPLPGRATYTQTVLNTIIGHSFSKEELPKAHDAIKITLCHAVPILKRAIVDKARKNAGLPMIYNDATVCNVTFEFTSKYRNIFWCIYNNKIV